ncbi:hypothetical protein [Archangium lansingense]|uniref:Helix-turn-helix protein n=1 Tax=Archangium lansingense TaxID=2995310 RepID=A0ABT4AQK7_9BACT|nr:hypothetical protein [Archangium lansinium]MCY1083124.1 hypothetical protein [Archangium lansinium]
MRVSSAPKKPMPMMAIVCPGWMSLRRKIFMAQPSRSPGNGLLAWEMRPGLLACGSGSRWRRWPKKVGLKSGVYGRVERGAMVPSEPTLRRMCESTGGSSSCPR